MNTNTGSYIALSGIIVTILSHFGITTTVDDIASVIGAIAIVYGIIHQYVITKKIVSMAKTQGITGLR